MPPVIPKTFLLPITCDLCMEFGNIRERQFSVLFQNLCIDSFISFAEQDLHVTTAENQVMENAPVMHLMIK